MSYYKNGIVSIPNVTGDIEITASAAKSAPEFTNLIPDSIPYSAEYTNGYHLNYRLNSSKTESATNGCIVSGYIPVHKGDTVRFVGGGSNGLATGWYIASYDSSKNGLAIVANQNIGEFEQNELTETYGYTVDGLSSIMHNDSIAYIRVSVVVGSSAATNADAQKFICTVNEEIV